MKIIGLLLISIGIALVCFVAFSFWKESNRTLTPIPDDRGVKVYFVTPTPAE